MTTKKKPKKVIPTCLPDRQAKGSIQPAPFTETDFVESLDATMQQQLLEHPELKSVYTKLTPEFESLVLKVALLYDTLDDDLEQATFANLLQSGEPGLLATLEYLLHLKKAKGPM